MRDNDLHDWARFKVPPHIPVQAGCECLILLTKADIENRSAVLKAPDQLPIWFCVSIVEVDVAVPGGDQQLRRRAGRKSDG